MTRVIKSTWLRSSDAAEEFLVTAGDMVPVGLGLPQEAKALSIVDSAKAQAREIIEAAEAEAVEIRAQAAEQGKQEAMAEVEALKADTEQSLAALRMDVDTQLEGFWEALEPEVLTLSLEIAKKVIKKRISETDGFVLETIKAGLRQLRDRQELKIRVCPEDYQLVRDHKEDIMSSYDGVRSVEVIDDRRVDEGGCIIESSNGLLDARIETQMGEVERALTEAEKYGRNNSAES